MKKIGFIDHSIDEWHANNFPGMIKDSGLSDSFSLSLAWEKETAPGKKSLEAWCAEQGVGVAQSIEQIVDECDVIAVLAPDHVESHEELADLALRSGKPVYIDKPFAPSLEVAKRLFAKAEQHGTPLMSCSALRYAPALELALKGVSGPIRFASVSGGGSSFEEYAIHQIEMLVMALGVGASRIMHGGNSEADLMVIDYSDGRRGVINLVDGAPFEMTLRSATSGTNESPQTLCTGPMDGFFPRFINAMLHFFESGKQTIPQEQTLEIMAIVEAATRTLGERDKWHTMESHCAHA